MVFFGMLSGVGVVAWIMMSVAVAIGASARGLSFGGYLLGSLLLSPLFMFTIAILTPPKA